MEGMSAGADDFVSKPVGRDELAARLHVAERIVGLKAEVRTLQGMLPICSYCKKIRTDEDSWQQIEAYVQTRSDASFSHGICPDCYEVSADVRGRVAAAAPQAWATTARGTPAIDLVAGAVAQLRAAGCRAIGTDDRCTAESETLFSHRRDGVTGRQGVLAVLGAAR